MTEDDLTLLVILLVWPVLLLVLFGVSRLVVWHRRQTAMLDRISRIHGLERQPEESNRSLARRVRARESYLLRGPFRKIGQRSRK